MGTRTRTLFCFSLGCQVYSVVGDARSRRRRAEGWTAGGSIWQGDLYLDGAGVLSAVTGWGAGGGAVVCESGERVGSSGCCLVCLYAAGCKISRCTKCASESRAFASLRMTVLSKTPVSWPLLPKARPTRNRSLSGALDSVPLPP